MPFVLGLSHRTAPVYVREKLAWPPHQIAETLGQIQKEVQAPELVLLSTCNRTEFYCRADSREAAHRALVRSLESFSGDSSLAPHLYYYEGEQAVRHLFSVAAGLDSMVQGENEILGQIKQAYLAAHQAGLTGKLLNVLFQRSLFVGKRVRTETGLSVGASSVGSVAVAMAERIFGDLRERRVMILGAGKMAEITAKHLLSRKVRSLIVANRSFDHACKLARQFSATAMHFEEGLRQMAEVDVVICSTAAPQAVITPAHTREMMEKRMGRSLFLIDIAIPRNVDPAVNAIDNVYLYNLDDLQRIIDERQSRRTKEVAQARSIVEEETHEFTRWLMAHRAGLHAGLKHHASPSL
jgi:glutamyl-tRNA reductase